MVEQEYIDCLEDISIEINELNDDVVIFKDDINLKIDDINNNLVLIEERLNGGSEYYTSEELKIMNVKYYEQLESMVNFQLYSFVIYGVFIAILLSLLISNFYKRV